MAKRKRVLSGMRPTGRLHLGHYFGALQNWLKLQEEYDCFFFVADWHALTTHYEDTSSIAENTLQVTMDWLSVGLDPAKSTMFIQSSVLEHAELHLLLSMITPLSWLERVPTYKEQIENLKERDLGTYGFLGYPLLQAADIVMYGEPRVELLVPVGEDQVPHIEMTREIVRRFNAHFGLEIDDELFTEELSDVQEQVLIRLGIRPGVGETWKDLTIPILRKRVVDVIRQSGFDNAMEILLDDGPLTRYFKEQKILRQPDHLLTETPRLPGLDGRRMAKSYGNAIWLSDPPDEIRAKVRNMMTDPQRAKRTDPGRPEVCPVFAWHKLFSSGELVARIDSECRTAAIGCVDCKKLMAENLVTWIEPVQARRKEFEAHPEKVWGILDAGGKKAHATAKRTMKRVRNAIFQWDEARKSSATSKSSS
ncbi:MAG: tryptophan--tRNA ligase [Candidatus Acidiferrales bacterium]